MTLGAGQPVIAFGRKRLEHAGDLLAGVAPELLKAIKVRSGEHLAALVLTEVFLSPPAATGGDGDVDLRFLADTEACLGLFPAGDQCIEVKSLSGAFREFDATIDRALERGEPTPTNTWVCSADLAPLGAVVLV